MGSFPLSGIFALPQIVALPLKEDQESNPPQDQDSGNPPQDHYKGEGNLLPGKKDGAWVNPFENPGVFAAGTNPFKDVKELIEAMTDAKLFGEVLPTFEKERGGKYFKVNIALYAIREVLQGGPVKPEFAKAKIEAWLNDYDLLHDTDVAHLARVNLIKALERAPEGDDKLKQNVKLISDTLSATYSPSKPEEKPKEDQKPKGKDKKEEKKPEEKKPEEKKPPEDSKKPDEKPKDPPADATPSLAIKLAVFSYMDSNKVGPRQDTFTILITKVNPILKDAYAELLKQFPKAEMKGAMRFIIDNKTGNVVKVSFMDMKITGVDKENPVLAIFQSIAQKLNAQVSLEKQGSDPAQEVEWPIDMKPPPPPPKP